MPELMDGTYISDQEDQEGYLGYDDTHCEHGTFVGGWAGPDYMCHWCEDGVSLREYQEIMARSAERRLRYHRVWHSFWRRAKTVSGIDKGTPEYDTLMGIAERYGRWFRRYQSFEVHCNAEKCPENPAN